MYVELSLNPWNEANLNILYDLFNALLNSIAGN
jgi:hypothetical protein